MVYVFVRHKVKDFDKWKPVFDEHATNRKDAGSQGGRLFRNADNLNEIVTIFKWDTIENARKFCGSEDLKKAMEKAGVIDKPDIFFLEESA